MEGELRQELIATAREMNSCGLNQGTSGNLSVRNGDGMLITPSGMSYEFLEEEDIVFINREGVSSGSRKASSEWRIHHDVYREHSEANAILHAHPVYCSALACLNRSLPAFHYMVATGGGNNIRCASYATFGTRELSDHVLKALAGRKACLMANHGLLCFADNLAGALARAVEIEHLAHTYMKCLSVEEPVILDDGEMNTVLEKFRDYGNRG